MYHSFHKVLSCNFFWAPNHHIRIIRVIISQNTSLPSQEEIKIYPNRKLLCKLLFIFFLYLHFYMKILPTPNFWTAALLLRWTSITADTFADEFSCAVLWLWGGYWSAGHGADRCIFSKWILKLRRVLIIAEVLFLYICRIQAHRH